MAPVLWYSSGTARCGLVLSFRYNVCLVQAWRDLGVADRISKFKPGSNAVWCERVLEPVKKDPDGAIEGLSSLSY